MRPFWGVGSKMKDLSQKARNRVFVRRNFEERGVLGSYYRSVAYGDLQKELQGTKRYEKKYTEVTAESFRRWTSKMSEVSSDSERQRHFL